VALRCFIAVLVPSELPFHPSPVIAVVFLEFVSTTKNKKERFLSIHSFTPSFISIYLLAIFLASFNHFMDVPIVVLCSLFIILSLSLQMLCVFSVDIPTHPVANNNVAHWPSFVYLALHTFSCSLPVHLCRLGDPSHPAVV